MFRLTAVLRLQVCSGSIGPRRSAWPLPPHPNPLPSGRGAGFVFRLTAVLRLHVFGMDRAMPISLASSPSPQPSPSGRGGWFCVSADGCVAFTRVRDGSGHADQLAPSPTPALSLRERGLVCVSPDSCVAFTGVFGMDRATPISLASSPSPQPSPSGRGGWFCVSPDSCVAFTGVLGMDRAMPISLPPPPHPNPLPQGGGWSVFRLTAVLRLQVCSGGSGHVDQLAPHPSLSPEGRGSYPVYVGSHALADGIACTPIWKPAPTSPLAPLGRGLG